MKKYKRIIALFSACIAIHHASPKQITSPIKIGNFALPSSQQPGPLFGVGQNIIDKGVCQVGVTLAQNNGPGKNIIDFAPSVLFCQVGVTLAQNNGPGKNIIDFAPSVLYGVTDQLSILVITPINLCHKSVDNGHSGIQSFIAQSEYAFYKDTQQNSERNATFIASIAIPTLSSNQPRSLLAISLSQTTTRWYCFASPGALFTIPKQNTNKDGNQYFFQCGVGRNIPSSPNMIALAMVELYGTINQHDKNQGRYNHNSGGQVLYLGPTLWLSTKNFFIQSGIVFPIYQRLYGLQNKNSYLAAISLAITL